VSLRVVRGGRGRNYGTGGPLSYRGWRSKMAQSFDLGRAEEQILEARKRLAEQKAKLDSLIVKGAPTQAAEDVLCKLHETLERLMRRPKSFG